MWPEAGRSIGQPQDSLRLAIQTGTVPLEVSVEASAVAEIRKLNLLAQFL